MDDVQFDTDTFAPPTRAVSPRRQDWADWLVAKKVVKTRRQAQMALIGFAVACFAFAFWMLLSSGRPPEPNPEDIIEVAALP